MLSKELKRIANQIQAGFSSDNEEWYDLVIDHPEGTEELLKIAQMRPTKRNFLKFKNVLEQTKGPWQSSLLEFITNMEKGKYKNEFGAFSQDSGGNVSQVSELFSLFRQAAKYYDEDYEPFSFR